MIEIIITNCVNLAHKLRSVNNSGRGSCKGRDSGSDSCSSSSSGSGT